MKQILAAIALPALLAMATAPAAETFSIPEPFSTADFVQHRHVPALDKPLLSSGAVSLTDVGFTWMQTQPYEVSLRFDGTTIVETSRLGGQEHARTIRDPFVSELTRALFQVMAGSWEQMQAQFEMIPLAAPGGDTWALELRPRAEAVRNAVPRIVLRGERYLEEILIEQDRGGTTRIELNNQQPPE